MNVKEGLKKGGGLVSRIISYIWLANAGFCGAKIISNDITYYKNDKIQMVFTEKLQQVDTVEGCFKALGSKEYKNSVLAYYENLYILDENKKCTIDLITLQTGKILFPDFYYGVKKQAQKSNKNTIRI